MGSSQRRAYETCYKDETDFHHTAAAVATYVARTLHHESQTMDRMFAQKNTPEVEARRKQQLLTETEGDPRRSLFNILGWK